MAQAGHDQIELRSDIGEVLGRRKKNTWVKYAVIGVVAVLMVAAVVYLLLPREEPRPEAVIDPDPDIDLNRVPAGTGVWFDAGRTRSENGISTVSWDFGDGETDQGINVTHAFKQKGTFIVKVTVTDRNGQAGTAELTVIVVGTKVTIPVGRLGDTIDYDISGFLDISNPDGFWTYVYTETIVTKKVTVTVDVLNANISMIGGSTGTVENGQDDVTDGFGNMHSCVERSTTQSLVLDGTADLMITKPGIASTYKDDQEISGEATADQQIYSDLKTNKTIRTHNTDEYRIQVGKESDASSKEKEGTDDVTAFPKGREEFSVDKLRANRTFTKGESGERAFGENTVEWKVEREDAVGATPCLVVHMWMNDASMSRNGLDVFDIYAWVSNEFSMPLKVYLRSEGTENGNTVVIDYTSVYTSYTAGSAAIPFGDCSGDHDMEKRSGVDYVKPDQYAPAMGDPGSLEEYELPDAVDYAKAHSTGLKNFLGQNPSAFLLNASSDEFTGDRGWDLYFGKSDDTQAYHVFVTKTSIEDYGKETVNPIGRSVGGYSTLMTFSSAEEVMKGDTAIGDKVYTSGGDFKFASYSLGCRSDVPIPTPDVPISFDIITGATEYYFYVESKDGKYSAGVDGATGQILFVQTKTS